MSRIDDTISDVAYILDCLRVYRSIVRSGDCNSCTIKKDCEYKPDWGEQVRYNCPFYQGDKKDEH